MGHTQAARLLFAVLNRNGTARACRLPHDLSERHCKGLLLAAWCFSYLGSLTPGHGVVALGNMLVMSLRPLLVFSH